MKILIPINVDNNSIENNPFVNVISSGLRSKGHEVVCSRDLFWDAPYSFDIIFFQWPDKILTDEQYNDKTIEVVIRHLSEIKQKRIKMVVTVHNLHPHDNDGFVMAVYDAIYGFADAFHHMGHYSFELMKSRYTQARHFIVPHPIPFDVVDVSLSQHECKKKYGLSKRKPVILSFGAVRNKEERKMLIELAHHFWFKFCIWVPKFNRYSGVKRNRLSKIITYIIYRLNGIKMERGEIGNSTVKEMVKAADIIFIQRKDILNSGNLPLGFSAGKIVVGPDVGNVGVILRNTGNPVFDPYDNTSIHNALDMAFSMLKNSNSQGHKNYQYAKDNWTHLHVADLLSRELQNLTRNA